MRSRDLQQQFERALATAEATLSLLREQLSEAKQRQDAQTHSDREWFEKRIDALSSQFAQLFSRQDDLLVGIQDMLAIPRGDTPTVEELIEQAKAQPAVRKQLENTLAELEFSDPQIEFN